MAINFLPEIIFSKNTSIRRVLESFNETAIKTDKRGFGMIISETGKCIGVVTDGDIRRKISTGISLDDPIKVAMNTNFRYATISDNSHNILRLFDQNIFNIPVLNHNNEPIDLHSFSNYKALERIDEKIIRARVPVRITYSGGGTDMSYYMQNNTAAVLSSTITKYCTASILVRPDKKIRLISKDLGIQYDADSLDSIKFGDRLDLVKAAVKIMKPDFGFDLETHSDIDAGTGLGGSSALTVAIIGAFNYFRNEKQLGIYDIADFAYQSERMDLGIAGGWQDQYSTAFGGFNWIEFREKEVLVNQLRIMRDVILELKYNLMLFRFGGTHDSGKIHSLANNGKDRAVKNKIDLYAKMTILAVEMKEALLKGKLKRFGDLLDVSWQLKKLLNRRSTNSAVDNLYSLARKAGALGGKVLGAGDAGYMLIYASPKFHQSIQESFYNLGAKQESFDYTNNGLEVWSVSR